VRKAFLFGRYKLMKRQTETKEHLINELAEMRRRIAELEKADTERKRAEEALRESESKFQEIYHTANALIMAHDRNWKVVYMNPYACKVLGYEEGEMIGKDIRPMLEKSEYERAEPVRQQVTIDPHMQVEGFEQYYLKKGGGRVLISWNVTAFKDTEGNAVGILGVGQDITERERVEEVLQREKDLAQKYLDVARVMLVVINADEKVSLINRKGCETLGCKEKEIIGKNWFDIFIPERMRTEIRGVFAKLMAGEIEPVEYFENPVLTKSGEERIIAWYNTVLRDDAGNISGTISSGEDITERKRAEEKIDHLTTVLRAIRNVNQLITIEKDSKRMIKGACVELVEARGYFNAWIALLDESSMLVSTAEAGLGKDFTPIVEMLKRGELTACGRRALKQSGVIIIEEPLSTCIDCPLAHKYGDGGAMTVRLEYGRKVYGLMSVSIPRDLAADEEEQTLFREVAGDIAQALHNINLEEERKLAEEALEESEEFSTGLLDNSPTPILVINADTSIRYVNPALEKLTGFSNTELVNLKAPYPWWTEETLKKTSKDLEEATSRGAKRLEELFQKKNGERFWVEITSRQVISHGELDYYLANWVDITERKRAEEERERSTKRVEALHSIAQAVSHSMDMDEMLNQSLDRVLEVMDNDVGGIYLADLQAGILSLKVHSGMSDEYVNSVDLIKLEEEEVKRAIEQKEPVLELDKVFSEANTARIAAAMEKEGLQDYITVPLWSKGVPLGALVIADRRERQFSTDELDLLSAIGNEIAVGIENATLLERTRELSITDELTGLHNRRHFYQVLESEQYRTKRYGRSFSLAMLDLDGFKEYNDRFGHASGDGVLQSFAQTLKSSSRKSDISFRYGGDEFTVILPATDTNRAKQIIDRIRAKWLQTAEAQYPAVEPPLKFSAGIAQFPKDAETGDGLVFLADSALYFAKREEGYRAVLVSDLSAIPPDVLSAATLDQVYALAATVDARDPFTYGHSGRVAEITQTIGKTIGLAEKELADLYAASLLHDVGKVGVPDAVLTKPDVLTEEEWEIIKKHSAEGARIAGYIKGLGAVVPVIKHHHEWYDGTGYPDGLKGEEIPLGARIISVADAYDTMTTARPYRAVVSQQEALEELRRFSGTQFDPELVEAFCRAMNEDKGKVKKRKPASE